ncbi:myosin light chain 5 isoform 2-T6 [Callospermophilus lateralis]
MELGEGVGPAYAVTLDPVLPALSKATRGTKPLHQNSPWGIPQARPEASGPAPGAGEGGQVSSYGRVPSQPPLCLNIEKTPALSPNPASPLPTSDLPFPPQQLCPRLRVWGEFTYPSLYPTHLPGSTLPKSPALFWGHPGEQPEWAASVNKGRGAGGDVPALVNPPPGFATGKTNVKDDELDAMLREASGPINFTMFLNLFGEKLTGTDTEETILNAFKMLDPDGKGSIHKEYIKRLLMSQADKMTATEVDQMLEFASIDAAGNLDYKALSYVLTHGEEKEE